MNKTYKGVPCPQGHAGERFVDSDACVDCVAHQKKQRAPADLREQVSHLQKEVWRMGDTVAKYQEEMERLEKENRILRKLRTRRVRNTDVNADDDLVDILEHEECWTANGAGDDDKT